MRRPRFLYVSLFVAVLVLGLALSALAHAQLKDSETPGSVLVFHEFIRGTVVTPDQGTLPRTELEISVSCPTGASCPLSQTAHLEGHWVCPGRAERGGAYEGVSHGKSRSDHASSVR